MNKKRMFFPLFCLLLFACEADVPESRSAKPAIKTSEQLATTVAPAADVARPAVLAEPDFEVILGLPTSELRDVVALYSTDRSGLLRRYDVQYSPARRAWLQAFYEGWRSRLVEVEFDALGVEGRIDYVLLGNQLRYELELLAREEKLSAEMETFMPFAGAIIALDEARRRMESVAPATVAAALATLTDEIEQTRKAVEEMLGNTTPATIRSSTGGSPIPITSLTPPWRRTSSSSTRKLWDSRKGRTRRSWEIPSGRKECESI